MKPHLHSNPFLRRIVLGLAATAVVSFTLPSARAAALTWDTVPGDGATITAGSGTWDTSAGNTVWNNAGANVAWTQTSATVGSNTAIFGGTDGSYAITLGEALAAQTLTFNNSGYTLSAAATQTLTLTNVGSSIISVASGKSATIGSNAIVVFNGVSNTGTRTDLTTGGTLDIAAGGTLTRTGQITTGFSATGGTLGFMGSGTLNVAGTLSYNVATPVATGGIVLSANAGNNNTLNVNGGTVSSNSTINGLSLVASGTGGTLTVTSGLVSTTGTAGVTSGINLANGAGTTGTVNLNGGTISTFQINSNYLNGSNVLTTGGTSTFNFNGGTLKSIANNAAFMNGLTAANVRNGGAIIDTNGFNVTIGQVLAHSAIGGDNAIDGGLTKNGAGTLTLNGANTFTGPTIVNAGTLAGTGSLAGSLTLTAGSGLSFDTAGPALAVAGGVNITGPTNVTFTGTPAGGTYDILNYSGGSLSGFANLTPPPTIRLVLNNNTISSLVQGTISTGTRTWNTTSGTWEVGGPTLNWAEGDKKFFNGDDVVFNNPASPSIVTLNGALLPASVYVNNTTNAYTFSGTGSISGVTGLTKDSSGTLILTTNNTYTGSTVISAGTLQLGDGTTDGTIASTAIVANEGVLAYNLVASRTAPYPISGSGSLIKDGAGTLTLSSATSNFTGGTTISTGTLVTNGGALSGGSISIASGATLTLNGGTNSSAITGAGAINNNTNGTVIFTGDHSGFTGTFTQNGANNTQFNSATAGSPSASYSLVNGEILFAIPGDYTVKFGSLSSATGMIVRGSNAAANAGTVTVEVGALNVDSVLLGSLNNGAAGGKVVALTKVGTGKLTLAGTNNFTGTTTIAGGELAVTGASLIDSGTVVINAGKLNLTGTETVDKLFFGGVQQPAGSYTATGDSTHFSGEGTLVVTSPAALGYSSWATANAPGQTKDQDHDNDGVKNGIEYFMGLSGSGFTANPALSGGTVTWTKGGSYTGSYGTDFLVQSSTDLVNWVTVPVGTDPILGTVANNAGSVTYTPPVGQTKRFGRLVVNN